MSANRGYHAHVYYNVETKPQASQLREMIIEKFNVEPGGFSDEPRGPHPISQFNVIFKNDEFQNIVPWLMLNREGLDVLVHPLTDSFLLRPQQECDVARHTGADEARYPASELSG